MVNASQFFRDAVDLLLPPRCLSCGSYVSEPASVCGHCFKELAFIAAPLCDACGFPFEFEQGDQALCGACLARHPDYDHARAVFAYNNVSGRLVTQFKYGDKLHMAQMCGRWMANTLKNSMEPDYAYLIPIPLHRKRLFTRRYNQSAILAQVISEITGIPTWPDLLVRIKDTPPQASLGRLQRLKNVRTAFAVNPRHAKKLTTIKGQKLLLIDDVMTTGATVEACARTLKRAGARQADVLTLARTVIHEQPHDHDRQHTAQFAG